MADFTNLAYTYLNKLHIPSVRWTDVVEILIISFLIYEIFLWIKNTRAWLLLRGLIIIMVFMLAAVLLNMSTILWIASNVFSLSVTALIVILQPELRRAMEQLGRTNILAKLMFSNSQTDAENISDKTIDEIVSASFDMGKVKTGALIVIQQTSPLEDTLSTGIEVDAVVTSQLLINIFEHNTPLHDGAVVITRNRVSAATCYLPLSANMDLSKDLGTRHRAGVGISEVTDSMTVIVSEETGRVSVAYQGEIIGGLDPEGLKSQLTSIQLKPQEDKKKRRWRGLGAK